MGIGRTIRIYLDDGSIAGIRHAEIVNWTGQAISAPRTQVKTLSDWDESKKPGVYFLFGVDDVVFNSNSQSNFLVLRTTTSCEGEWPKSPSDRPAVRFRSLSVALIVN